MWFGRHSKREQTPKTTRRRSPSKKRALRIEAYEPRLLLAHSAPEVSTALIAHFNPVPGNEPIGSNSGETISSILTSGGTGALGATTPLQSGQLACYDQADGGSVGIAVTGVTGTAEGAWQYQTPGAAAWLPVPINLSTGNALLLSGTSANDDLLRFLPNNGFTGQVLLQFAFWDQSDAAAPGSLIDMSTAGRGGSSAYSSAVTFAALDVANNVPPSFNLKATAATVLENNNGGNSGTQTAPNAVSSVSAGNGGNATVTYSFTSSPAGEVLNPAIDANGTLTFNLAQGTYYGTVTLNVTATNGALSTTQSTQIVIEQTTPPSFTAANEQVVENSGAASDANWAQNVSVGQNGGGGSLTYSIVSDNDPSLFSSPPAFAGGGNTLTFAPATGQIGVATLTAAVTNSLTGLTFTAPSFTIGVYAVPTVTAKKYVIDYTAGGAAAAANGVLSGDTDPNSAFDGGMTAQVVTPPTNGTLSLGPGGYFSYSPGGPFQGYDQFTYKAVSGAASATQTVTIYSHEGAMVQKLFTELLQRSASATDVDNWAAQLHSGSLSMLAFGGDIIESAEHLNRVTTGFFNSLLGRAPSSSDLTYWNGMWTGNSGPAQEIAGIATTDECFAYAQTQYDLGDENENWVALLYPAILNRPADSGALSYYKGQLDNGTMTRTQVVNALLGSPEYYDDMVNDAYILYLDRSPSSAEQQSWETSLQDGMTQLTFQEDVIQSNEYTGNPPAATGGAADLWTP